MTTKMNNLMTTCEVEINDIFIVFIAHTEGFINNSYFSFRKGGIIQGKEVGRIAAPDCMFREIGNKHHILSDACYCDAEYIKAYKIMKAHP